MKKRMLYVIVTGIIACFSIITYAQIQKTHFGPWKFEAPNAPEGSTMGLVIFSADTATMTFDGYEAFPSSWVRVNNDSIIYEVDFGDTKVLFSLKVNDEKSMTGKAVWDEGETPVLLTKAEAKPVGVKI